MSERMKESLSALIDGEANELELQRLLRDSGDPELRATWARYNRVSRIMREGRDEHWELDISARVSELIGGETAALESAPADPGWRRSLRPLASFAVAASVFAAVLVGSQLYGLVGVDTSGSNSLAGRVSPVGLVDVMGGAAVNANFGNSTPADERLARKAAYDRMARQRLERYILPHTEQAALNSPQGMMPYARVTAQKGAEK